MRDLLLTLRTLGLRLPCILVDANIGKEEEGEAVVLLDGPGMRPVACLDVSTISGTLPCIPPAPTPYRA